MSILPTDRRILEQDGEISVRFTRLTPPVATAASGIGGTSFTANWNAVVPASLLMWYVIQVATDANFVNLVSGYSAKIVGNATSFQVTGLAGVTPYYYRVYAYGSGGYSRPSNVITLTTSASTFLLDPFDGANMELSLHAGTPATWVKVSGSNMLVDTGAIRPILVGGPFSVYRGVEVAASADHKLRWALQRKNADGAWYDDIGVVGRFNAGANDGYLAHYNFQLARIELYRLLTGTLLGTFALPLVALTSVFCELRLNGNTQEVWTGPSYAALVQRIVAADANVPAGTVMGVRAFVNALGSQIQGVHIEEVSMVSL